jgi:Mlc titration factor MtfA (ptsG expression regulator)
LLRFLQRWLVRPDGRPADRAALAREIRDMPLLAALGPQDADRLAELAARFLRRKGVEGAAGLEVDDGMRRCVALQACLPVLRLGPELYRGWHAVVLYPDEFRAPVEFADEAGVVHQGSRDLSGEAWHRGPVILAWSQVHQDALDPEPAGNVVIHEMAHKLDMLNGEVNGMPPLHRGMDPRLWSATMGAAFEDLNAHLDADLEPPIDPYAAHSPGEFFAVVSELFFAWPEGLIEPYPEVYEQLARYYRQDPAGCYRETPAGSGGDG